MTRRVLTLLTLISIVAAYFGFVAFQKNQQTKTEAESHEIVELQLARVRADNVNFVSEFAVMFPEELKHTPKCYQVAVSNFVEDRWNKIAAEGGCDNTDVLCEPQRFKQSTWPVPWWASKKWAQKWIIAIDNAHAVGARLANMLVPVRNRLDPNDKIAFFAGGNIAPPSLNPKLVETGRLQEEQLYQYVDSCDTKSLPAWAEVGRPFPDSKANLDDSALKLGNYGALLEFVMAADLPDDEKGYVSCLRTFVDAKGKKWTPEEGIKDACSDRECMETVQLDTKEHLFKQINELISHQCSSTAAYDISHR